MFKVSKLADYAVVILSVLSRSDQSVMPASALAEETRIPEPTVAKIMKRLAKNNIVQSVRGANGGYMSTRSQGDISISEIIQAIDGPLTVTSCVEHGPHDCGFANLCPTKGAWNKVNNAIEDALEDIKLSDMVRADYAAMNLNKEKENAKERAVA